MPCQMVPPTAPMAKALPKSERITHGLWTLSAPTSRMQNTASGRTRDRECGLRGPWRMSSDETGSDESALHVRETFRSAGEFRAG